MFKRIVYPPKPRNIIGVLHTRGYSVGSECVVDVEVFRNFVLVGFKHLETQTYFSLVSTFNETMNVEYLRECLWRFKLISFNGRSYDIPIIEAILRYASVTEIKELSDAIIYRDERQINYNPPFNHIDLIEVTPLGGSLKLYGARLHSPRLQELPIDPQAELTPEEMLQVWEYNANDLDVTELVYNELRPHIKLREELGNIYGRDFRSLSDAQIAEQIITSEIEKVSGKKPKKPGYESAQGLVFRYKPPSYVRFDGQVLNDVLNDLVNSDFHIDVNGYAVCPKSIDGRVFKIGSRYYTMGLGGLHSQETCQSLRATDQLLIIDRDVTGYYPNLILKNKFIGEVELAALQNIVDKRTAAKKSKDMVTADSLKIASNGTFGKTSNPYSIVYDPRAMVQTTISGQLSLLMLIEMLDIMGFEVVSANTDGIITLCPVDQYTIFKLIFEAWEKKTGLETEETRYAGLYSRDVNNYIAVKENGEIKGKGAYTEKGSALNSVLSKNPETLICIDAVKAFLSKGTPLHETIYSCRDVRRFVSVRNVRGGAHKDGYYLGRVVRWYYAKATSGAIHYVTSGNKVPKTDGAKPLMELGDFPSDVNFAWYENEALQTLYDVGFYRKTQNGRLL